RELDLDAAHHRPHRRDVQIGQRGAQVVYEDLDEPWAVLALERQLFVVDDDTGHLVNWSAGYLVKFYRVNLSRRLKRGLRGEVAASHGALDRRGQTRVDPVAGEKQTADRRGGRG